MNWRDAYHDIAISMPATFIIALVLAYLVEVIVFGTSEAELALDVAFSLSIVFGILIPIATMPNSKSDSTR